MGAILTRATLSGSLAQVRHVTPVPPGAAPEHVRAVYAQVERDFGMLAPPVILHSPAPESLAACWTMLRESLLAAGAVGRPVKEAVAAAVSHGNRCPYCVDVHAATLRGLTRGRHAAEIAAGRLEVVDDPAIRDVAEWARDLGRRETARRPPGSPAEAAELVAVAVVFHYLNRMVNVFLGDSPLPPEVPARARPGLMRLFGLVMSPAARRAGTPGLSLDLLPAAPPLAELAWANGSPRIAKAFARAAAATDAAGRRSVPEPVRELVGALLDEWDGAPPGPSRAWAAEAVRALPETQRPAGRLALLTAMASYQVDQGVVDDFRRGTPEDRALVELVSWASLAAARRVGARAVARPAAHASRSDHE
ncbi:carboxymuconolactone decarboxylase family protein [Microbispora siamensis]|uniref:Alkyl hydroperoxide reductase AhpD n=1 Tax=Microbispora siamensis TaxID=564413 RepID=A0ABQ4GZJ1_9ACTN|nr:carboxymuconolactone decarboxylase family protein [Microbispora siamensis]GIH66841.1 alkyl hydroperoxide reductase AhpD [Microbispora siamensis]